MLKIPLFRFCGSIFLLFISVASFAGTGDTITEPYKPLVVQITSEYSEGEEYGFGFIVGEDNKYLYVVTANHIVRTNDPDIRFERFKIRFSWDKGVRYVAQLLDNNHPRLDIALLRVSRTEVGAAPIQWDTHRWCSTFKDEEKVWFIGRQSSRNYWFVPPDNKAGVMLESEADLDGFLHFAIDSIRLGTSGAPLITEQGIIGMVLRDDRNEAIGLSAVLIKSFVNRYDYPWNLVHCGTEHILNPEPIPMPMPQPKPPNEAKKSTQNPQPAKTAKQGDAREVNGIKLVYVPGGCFQMGSNTGDSDEKPAHEVCVDDFWMGKYEVTQGEWLEIMGKNPAKFKKGNAYPVEQVSWDDAQSYISKLNSETGKKFRLPTEAEWEYGCRGNGSGYYCGGNNIDELAWYDENSDNSTHPVGTKQANGFALHDMSGNVWEWCADWYGGNYYGSSPKENPQGAVSGSNRVVRGGSWYFTSDVARVALRKTSPVSHSAYLGFRIVLPSQ